MADNVLKLYNALKDEGIKGIGDEKTFKEKVSNDESRKKLYDFLEKRGGYSDLGDYSTFSSKLGFSGQDLASKAPVAGLYSFDIGNGTEETNGTPLTSTDRKNLSSFKFNVDAHRPDKVNSLDLGIKTETNPYALLGGERNGLIEASQRISEQFAKDPENHYRAQLDNDISTLEERIKEAEKKKTTTRTTFAPGSTFTGGRYVTEEAPENYPDIDQAKSLLLELQNLRSAVSDKDKNSASQAIHEFGRRMGEAAINTSSFGISDLLKNYGLNKALKDPSKPLTREAFDLLGQYESIHAADRSIAQDIARGTSESLPFIAQYIATGGLAGASSKILGQSLAGIGMKTATKGVGLIAKNVGKELSEAAVRTFAMPQTLSQAYINNIKDPGSFLDAYAKAFASTSIENLSEGVGKYIPGLKFKNPTIRKIAQNTGIDGGVGEFAEEQIATALHSAAGDGQAKWSDLLDPRQQLVTLGTVGLMQIPYASIAAGGYAAGKARNVQQKRSINKAYEENLSNINTVFGESAPEIISLVGNVESKNKFESFMDEVSKTNEYSDDEKDAIFKFGLSHLARGGYLDAVNDEIETAKQQAIDDIDKTSNKDMNAVVLVNSGLSKDGPISIVGGTVSFDNEGNIDKSKSSDVIYYIDPETGKRKMGSPDIITSLVSSVPIDQAYADAMQTVTEEIVQREEADLNDPVDEITPGMMVETPNGPAKVTQNDGSGQIIVIDANGQTFPVQSTDVVPVQSEQPLEANQSTVEQSAPVAENQNINEQQTPESIQNQVSIGPVVEYPRTKDGSIDYDQISDSSTYASALNEEFGEDAPAVLDDLLSEANNALKKANKKTNAIEKRRAIKKVNGEIARLTEIKNILSPAVKTPEIEAQNEVSSSDEQNILSPEEQIRSVAENSNDPREIADTYKSEMEKAGYESLLPWQQALIGRRVNRASFERFGDKNQITRGLARAWFNPKGNETSIGSIDALAEELSEYGIPVSPSDIVDFMLEHPNNRINKGNETTKALNYRFKQVVRELTGEDVGNVDSRSGRLILLGIEAGQRTAEEKAALPFDGATIPDAFVLFVEKVGPEAFDNVNSFEELEQLVQRELESGTFEFPLSQSDYVTIQNIVNHAIEQQRDWQNFRGRLEAARSRRDSQPDIFEEQARGRSENELQPIDIGETGRINETEEKPENEELPDGGETNGSVSESDQQQSAGESVISSKGESSPNSYSNTAGDRLMPGREGNAETRESVSKTVSQEQEGDVQEPEETGENVRETIPVGNPETILDVISNVAKQAEINAAEKEVNQKHSNVVDVKVEEKESDKKATSPKTILDVVEDAAKKAEKVQGAEGRFLNEPVQLQINWDNPSDVISQIPDGLPQNKKGEMTSAERVLSEQKGITFMGESLTGRVKIESVQDVAFLFKNLESAASENVFVVLHKNDGTYNVLYLSTGNSNQSIVDIKQIAAAAKELKADSITLVHNHPSGILTPSNQDRAIHNNMVDALDIRVNDSVIINLDSGQFCVFSYYDSSVYDKKEVRGEIKEAKVYQFDRLKLYRPMSENFQIKSPADVAEFLSNQKRGINGKIHALILNNRNQVVRYTFLNPHLKLAKIADALISEVGKHGDSVVLASNGVISDSMLNAIQNRLKSVEVRLLDSLTIKQDADIINNYVSAMDEGVLREPSGRIETNENTSFRDDSLDNSLNSNTFTNENNTQNEISNRSAQEELRGSDEDNLPEQEVSDRIREGIGAIESQRNGEKLSIQDRAEIKNSKSDGQRADTKNGSLEFERKEGRSRNAETARRLGGYRQADRRSVPDTQPSKSEQERVLKEYAEKEGIWLDEKEIADNSVRKIPSGKEANVYLNEDGKTIVKVIDYSRYSKTPSDFLNNRILLFNRLFNNTAYKIVGFTQTGKGFSFVVEQPFIRGKELDRLATSVNDLIAQQKRVADYMKDKFGMNSAGLDAFSNGDFKVEDLHLKNVIEGEDGNIYIIDAIPSQIVEKQQEIAEEANAFSSSLNTPIRIITDPNEIPKNESRKRSAKGWYDIKTGEVVVVLPNNASVADVQATILHEVVAHKGLRGLLGDRFDDMMDTVYKNLPDDVRTNVSLSALNKYSGDFRTAIEEYLASIAEKGVEEPAVWNKIKSAIKEFFRSIGVNFKMTDQDIMYLLWKSKNRLERGDSPFDVIQKVAKDAEVRDALYRSIDDTKFNYSDKLDEIIKKNKARRAFVDQYQPLRALEKIVEESSSKKLGDFEKASLLSEVLQSVDSVQIEEWNKLYMSKIYDGIKSFKKKYGVKEDRVLDYMKVKSGSIRNERMRTDEATETGAPIDETKDFAGVYPVLGKYKDANYTLDNAGVQKFLSDFENDINVNDIKDLWSDTKSGTNKILEIGYKSGLIGREIFLKYSNDDNYYLPLRGWANGDMSDIYDYGDVGGAKQSFQDVMKKAEGRVSEADNPIAYIKMLGESEIMRANKNKMLQAVLRMVRNRPMPEIYTVNKIYEVLATDPNSGEDVWMEVMNKPDEQMFVDGKARTKFINHEFKKAITPYMLKENQVVAYELGEKYVITFTNPDIAKSIKGELNQSIQDKAVLTWLSSIQRFMSAAFTKYNPEFFLWTNLMRDVQMAGVVGLLKEGPKYVVDFSKTLPIAINSYRRMLNGKYDSSNEYDVYMDEFIRSGGETGYAVLKNLEKTKKEIEASLKNKKTLKQRFEDSGVIGALTDIGRVTEGMTRFSAYCASRVKGKSILQSTIDAKNITVNFNKRGSGETITIEDLRLPIISKFPFIKNMPISARAFQTGFVFFNASIQGADVLYQVTKENKGKMALVASSFYAAGFLMSMIGRILMGYDDDKDMSEYDKISDFVRRNNLIIPLGGKNYISIPLPQILRGAYGLGEMAYSSISGNMKGQNLGLEAASSLTDDLSPIDVGSIRLGDDWSLAGIIPSAVRPLWEAYIENKDFMGRSIAKSNSYNSYDPEYKKVFARTGVPWVEASKLLNNVSGGDEVRPGWANINPAKIEHIAQGYFGGLLSFGDKSISRLFDISKILSGENVEIEARDVPIVGKMYGRGSDAIGMNNIRRRFYKYGKDANLYNHVFKKYEDSDNYAKLDKFSNDDLEDRYYILKDANSEIGDLKKYMKDASDDKERSMWQDEIDSIIINAVLEYEKTEKEDKKK